MNNTDFVVGSDLARVTILVDANGHVIGLGRLHEGRAEALTLLVAVPVDAPPAAAMQPHRLRLVGRRFVDWFRQRLRLTAVGTGQ